MGKEQKDVNPTQQERSIDELTSAYLDAIVQSLPAPKITQEERDALIVSFLESEQERKGAESPFSASARNLENKMRVLFHFIEDTQEEKGGQKPFRPPRIDDYRVYQNPDIERMRREIKNKK